MRKIKVILQKDCPGLGFVGDEIEVRGGYARNYLIPNNVAFEAIRTDKGYIKHKLAAVLSKKQRLRSEAETLLKNMEGLVPEFSLKIGESGKSFGSISNRDVAKWLDEKGYTIDKSQIIFAEQVKKAGEYPVKVRLHSEITANLKIRVIAEAPVVTAAPADAEAGRGAVRKGRGRARKPAAETETAPEASENA